MNLPSLTRSAKLRDKIRAAEVKRLFAEQQDDSSEWPAAEHAKYMCPWRERRPLTGELGPYYGPTTEGAYERQMREYQDTREAGSLWDAEEAAKHGARAEGNRKARDTQRYDIMAVRRYVQLHDITPTELRVYYAFWEDEVSVGRIATKLGLAHTAVSSMVRRLRLKAQGRASSGDPVTSNERGIQ